jgi:hypothetical protein
MSYVKVDTDIKNLKRIRQNNILDYITGDESDGEKGRLFT